MAPKVTDYRTDGILPETMLNFLASMGWNDGTEQEIFSREELRKIQPRTRKKWRKVRRAAPTMAQRTVDTTHKSR